MNPPSYEESLYNTHSYIENKKPPLYELDGLVNDLVDGLTDELTDELTDGLTDGQRIRHKVGKLERIGVYDSYHNGIRWHNRILSLYEFVKSHRDNIINLEGA
jgi:hypothetical protein